MSRNYSVRTYEQRWNRRMKKDQYRDQISHDPENESDVDMESIVDESLDQIHDLSSNHTTTAHLPLLEFNDNDDL